MPSATLRERIKHVRTIRTLGNWYGLQRTLYALRAVPDFRLRRQQGQYDLSFTDQCGHGLGALPIHFAFDFRRWAWTVHFGDHTVLTERPPLWELIMELRGYLLAYMPQPGDAVLDIGASTGFISAVLARLVSPGGQVICLEPNPDEAEALRATLALNTLDNCSVIEAALAQDDRQAQFIVAGGSSRLVAGASAPAGTLTVQTISLPTLLAQLPVDTAGRLRMIKLDVEGAEVDVLDHLLSFLRDHPQVVINIASYHAYQGAETRSWIEARSQAYPFVMAKTIFSIHATTVLVHRDNLAGCKRLTALPGYANLHA